MPVPVPTSSTFRGRRRFSSAASASRQPLGRAVVARSEGERGLDLQRDDRSVRTAARSWPPWTRKRPARTGLQAGQRGLDPVGAGEQVSKVTRVACVRAEDRGSEEVAQRGFVGRGLRNRPRPTRQAPSPTSKQATAVSAGIGDLAQDLRRLLGAHGARRSMARRMWVGSCGGRPSSIGPALTFGMRSRHVRSRGAKQDFASRRRGRSLNIAVVPCGPSCRRLYAWQTARGPAPQPACAASPVIVPSAARLARS